MKVLTYFVLVTIIININSISIYSNVLYFKTVFNYLKIKAEDVIEKGGGNTQCSKDLKTLFIDLISKKKWSFEMLDASGKFSSGMLSGNYYIVGNFDQCMNIREIKNDTVIDGQYCTVVLMPSKKYSSDISIMLDSVAVLNYMGMNMSYYEADVLKSIKLTYGLCIPQSCSIENLQKIWDYIEHTFRVPVHVLFVDALCRTKAKPVEPYGIDQYVFAGFGIYLFILLTSTWYDVMIYQHLEDDKKQRYNYWIVFSLYTNTRTLFSYTTTLTMVGYFKCLSGIRVISMLWVVFGHRILLNVFSGNINGLYVFEWKRNIENTIAIGASFSVDTFLVLSGLLLSYGYLKYKSILGQGKKIPFAAFYIHRLLRLSPALLAIILFYISIYKRLSDGPIWPIISRKLSRSCLNTWWATLFFGTNLIDVNYQCVEQSWYLAVDTQLYIISPILLINLEKKPWKTSLACLGACLISAIYTFVITINNNYGAVYFEGNKDYLQHIYQPTFIRMPPWVIGILLGYIIFKYQQVRIPKGANICLWFFSLSLMVYLILIHVVFTRNQYDPLRSAVFNSCARSAWAIALSLIIYLCVTGHGGMVNQFLSLPIFQVLSKLSYSMYLVHLGVLLYFVGGKKHIGYFSNIIGIHEFMGDLFFAFIAATFWCLLFESPFIAISKIMKNREIGKDVVKIMAKPKKKRSKKNYYTMFHSDNEDKQFSDKFK